MGLAVFILNARADLRPRNSLATPLQSCSYQVSMHGGGRSTSMQPHQTQNPSYSLELLIMVHVVYRSVFFTTQWTLQSVGCASPLTFVRPGTPLLMQEAVGVR